MDILIITDYEGSWPYIPELKEKLTDENIKVDILDIGGLRLFECNNNIKPLARSILKYFLYIPKFRALMVIIVLKVYFRKNKKHYDILNIHFVTPLYIFLIKEFNKIAQKK